ncbi:MAG: hypothetical protein QOE92_2220 [Chloroflexota bacterium]|jgi:peptidoglycan hydrolase CwlO-like protein|nr:hypothetical protein [Chloroflexota bacterium]
MSLRSQRALLALLLALGGVLPALPAGADSLAALRTRRAALQAQVGALGAEQEAAFEQLQLVQDRLADLRRQVAHNQADLAALERRRGELEAQIAEARRQAGLDRRALGDVVRQQYKAREQLNPVQVLFSSGTLSEAVNRIVAARYLSDRAHDLIVELRGVEASLANETDDLVQHQEEVEQLQGELAGRRASLQSVAADYQSRIDGLNSSSADLLAQVKRLDAQIAAATSPPAGGSGYSKEQVKQIIRDAAARWGVDSDRLVRVAGCESGWNPRAYDPGSGASGLFQFMPGTFYGNGGHDIWDPYDQSDIAAKMFSQGRGSAWSCQ